MNKLCQCSLVSTSLDHCSDKTALSFLTVFYLSTFILSSKGYNIFENSPTFNIKVNWKTFNCAETPVCHSLLKWNAMSTPEVTHFKTIFAEKKHSLYFTFILDMDITHFIISTLNSNFSPRSKYRFKDWILYNHDTLGLGLRSNINDIHLNQVIILWII